LYDELVLYQNVLTPVRLNETVAHAEMAGGDYENSRSPGKENGYETRTWSSGTGYVLSAPKNESCARRSIAPSQHFTLVVLADGSAQAGGGV
jgi:hypothetical protein